MMGREQYFTFCKRCGKQILMTYCPEEKRWMPCNPEIKRFRRAGGPETYVTPDGKICRGERAYDGEYGYRKHRKDCVRDADT